MEKANHHKMLKALDNMLKESDIKEYHKDTGLRLLQVSHGLIEDLLLKAKKFGSDNGKNGISRKDVSLEIRMYSFPLEHINQQEMQQHYAKINRKPLPPCINKFGVLLPPDRALTKRNYRLKFTEKYVRPRNLPGNSQVRSKPRRFELIHVVDDKNNRIPMDYLKNILWRRRSGNF